MIDLLVSLAVAAAAAQITVSMIVRPTRRAARLAIAFALVQIGAIVALFFAS